MVNRILPGTYIDVCDEGLITAGSVASGNIGIVGTAETGPINTVQIIGSFAEAKQIFGESDSLSNPNPLTLIRALELIYNNGGKTVYAVRTERVAVASYSLKKNNTDLLTLSAKSAGEDGNNIGITITTNSIEARQIVLKKGKVTESYPISAEDNNFQKLAETLNKKSKLITASLDPPLTNGDALPDPRANTPFTGGTADKNASYLLANNISARLTLSAKSAGEDGNNIGITIATENLEARQIVLTKGEVTEKYTISAGDNNYQELAETLNKKSRLITASSSITSSEDLPDGVPAAKFQGGSSGANAGEPEYTTSLALLENEIINIVLLAGQDNSSSWAGEALEGHLKSTAKIKRERIGLIGSGLNDQKKDDLQTIAGHNFTSDRLIFVAPGIQVADRDNPKQPRNLSGAYTAAAVAGLIASLPVQSSPTNKTLTISGLSTVFNVSQLEKLVSSRVLVVGKQEGFRIIKGITTHDGAWQQITTRRIVDYAIYGVRSSCNPYIGKLNNERVRGAMKATLDSFLTRMVNDEALVDYSVAVSATRAQEIAGETMVTMTLKPTFSIDFITVTLYLG